MAEKVTLNIETIEALNWLPAEDYKVCMTAIFDYAREGIIPDLTEVQMAVFLLVKQQMDSGNASRENGKKGGRPKKNENLKKPNHNLTKPNQNLKKPNDNLNKPKNDDDPVDYTTEVNQSNQNLSNDYTVDFTESTENQKEKPIAKAIGKKKEPFFDDERLNEAFIAYLDMRKQIKKPATDKAIDLARSKLMKMARGDPDIAVAILEQSIMNSWQGLFELKEQPTKKLTFNDYSHHDYDMDELRRRAKA